MAKGRTKQMVDAPAEEEVEAAPYRLSRAAMRQRYGSRSINASAPPSANDSTPSARLRAAELEYGKGSRFADAEMEGRFDKMFRARPEGFTAPTAVPTGRPAGWGTTPLTAAPGNLNAPFATPESILAAHASGAQSAEFVLPTQYSGGKKASFTMAPPTTATTAAPITPAVTPLSFNLSTPSPIGASAIAPYLPTASSGGATGGYVPPWRRPQQQGYMGGVLSGASKWLT